jgi:hypothetical protein
MSGGLKLGPVLGPIGSQVLASDLPARSAFDVYAAIGGDLADALDPLVDGDGTHSHLLRESDLGPGFISRDLDGRVRNERGTARSFLSHGLIMRDRLTTGKPEPAVLPSLWSERPNEAMLTGKDLGVAIKRAVELKDKAERDAGRPGVRLVDVARHFGVKPPSVLDWYSKGTIAKSKLPALWLYFSDVVGPEHWGLASFPQARVTGEVFDEIATEDRDFLADFLLLPEEEQQQYRSEIKKRATNLRAYLEKQLQRFQKSAEVPPKDVAPQPEMRSTDQQPTSRPADLYGIDDGSGKKNAGSEHLRGSRDSDRRRA